MNATERHPPRSTEPPLPAAVAFARALARRDFAVMLGSMPESPDPQP